MVSLEHLYVCKIYKIGQRRHPVMSITRKGRGAGTDKDREEEEGREGEGPRAEREAPGGCSRQGESTERSVGLSHA